MGSAVTGQDLLQPFVISLTYQMPADRESPVCPQSNVILHIRKWDMPRVIELPSWLNKKMVNEVYNWAD